MGRRGPEPRSEIELWGDEGTEEALPHIQVGGRGARRTPLLITAVVVSLLAIGVALGGSEQIERLPREERDNRDRTALRSPGLAASTTTGLQPTTTATTPTTLLFGQVFAKPTGAAVVIPDSSARWMWLDLDSGLRREVHVEANDPYSAVPVRGGVVVLRGTVAEFVPLPDGEPVALGQADQLISSGRSDDVWLLRGGFEAPPSGRGALATLVNLQGKVVSDAVALPLGFPIGALERGLVFSRGGRTYLADSSSVRPIALGDALSASGDRLVVLACDDDAVCAPEVIDLAADRPQRLTAIANPFEYAVSVVIADDGRLAVITYASAGPSLVLVDRTGRVAGPFDGIDLDNDPAWLPGDLGLIAAGPDGFVRIFETDGGLVSEPIAALEGRHGHVVYVITG